MAAAPGLLAKGQRARLWLLPLVLAGSWLAVESVRDAVEDRAMRAATRSYLLEATPEAVGQGADRGQPLARETVARWLRRDPSDPLLLSYLARRNALAGNDGAAEKLLLLGNRSSRRDAVTQLALIEQAVQRDDITAALEHYHAALSVNPGLGETLLPILAHATAFQDVRSGLRPYFASRARWTPDLLLHLAQHARMEDLQALVASLSDTLKAAVYAKGDAAVISRLAAGGRVAEARAFAASIFPDLAVERVAAFGFSDDTIDNRIGALGWRLTGAGRAQAQYAGDGAIEVSVEPNAQLVVASRLFPVRDGQTYHLQARTRAGDPALRLRWSIACLTPPGSEAGVGRQPFATGDADSLTLQVPQGCELASFSLQAIAPESAYPAIARVAQVQLHEVGA